MPRIPDIEISRLKQAVLLTRLAEARGVALKGDGHNLLGLCPFHDDHEPSLVIDPAKNLWNCLGACGCGGSNIDWVMRDHGVGFRVAAEIIAAMAGGAAYPARPAGYEAGPMRRSSARRLANPLSPDADGEALLGQVADFYHRTLAENPLATAQPALDYLRSRKLDHAEMIRHFRIGYADRSLGLRVPDRARREGALLRLRLAKLGVIKDSGHELLFGAVVVPIIDGLGNTVGMYGRMTGDALRPGTAYHRYLPGPHRTVWNGGGAMDNGQRVIVCEAILDALSFWCHGFRGVTAAYGVNGFTAHHRALCTRDLVRSVFVAYDADEAGDTAAAALADELIAAGKSVYRVRVPVASKDINGLVMASADPTAALGEALRSAVFLGGPVRVSVPAFAPAPEPALEPALAREDAHTSAAKSAAAAAEAAPAAVTIAPTSPAPAPSLAAAAPVAAIPVPVLAAVNNAPRPEPVAVAPAIAPAPGFTVAGEDLRAAFGPRRYRVRGLMKNADAATLKVGLRLSVAARPGGDGDAFHQDTVDLCQAKQRAAFVAAAVSATGADAEAIQADLARLLDWCEQTWEAQRRAAVAPAASKRPAMTPDEDAAARAFLCASDLLGRIAADYNACGIVGEAAPKLVSYLCAVSRRLDQPLAVLTMAPSAAGKTSLQDGTLAFVPEEERLSLSAMTGQALHYIAEDLSHRVLAIAEEEGASRAAYSLKLLQSEGSISLAVPVKDPETGQIATTIKTVKGPVALFLTTTAPHIDEELANRCIVLTVDESAAQTALVHAAQRERETLDGLMQRGHTAAIRHLHQNAQRLLEAVAVVNPYARFLSFRADRPRTRRDHLKYLGLIRAIAFLHQHQRPRRTVVIAGRETTYIEVALADIAAANHLAAAVLGRSLDELAPQTRTLLLHLDRLVGQRATADGRARSAVRFTRREIREAIHWSADQVDIHLARLERLEYVISYQGGQGRQSVYSLAWDGQGQDGQPFVMGLADVDAIAAAIGGAEPVATASTSEGVDPHFRPTSDPVPRPFRGGSVGVETLQIDGDCPTHRTNDAETADHEAPGGISPPTSYRRQSGANGVPALALIGGAA